MDEDRVNESQQQLPSWYNQHTSGYAVRKILDAYHNLRGHRLPEGQGDFWVRLENSLLEVKQLAEKTEKDFFTKLGLSNDETGSAILAQKIADFDNSGMKQLLVYNPDLYKAVYEIIAPKIDTDKVLEDLSISFFSDQSEIDKLFEEKKRVITEVLNTAGKKLSKEIKFGHTKTGILGACELVYDEQKQSYQIKVKNGNDKPLSQAMARKLIKLLQWKNEEGGKVPQRYLEATSNTVNQLNEFTKYILSLVKPNSNDLREAIEQEIAENFPVNEETQKFESIYDISRNFFKVYGFAGEFYWSVFFRYLSHNKVDIKVVGAKQSALHSGELSVDLAIEGIGMQVKHWNSERDALQSLIPKKVYEYHYSRKLTDLLDIQLMIDRAMAEVIYNFFNVAAYNKPNEEYSDEQAFSEYEAMFTNRVVNRMDGGPNSLLCQEMSNLLQGYAGNLLYLQDTEKDVDKSYAGSIWLINNKVVLGSKIIQHLIDLVKNKSMQYDVVGLKFTGFEDKNSLPPWKRGYDPFDLSVIEENVEDIQKAGNSYPFYKQFDVQYDLILDFTNYFSTP